MNDGGLLSSSNADLITVVLIVPWTSVTLTRTETWIFISGNYSPISTYYQVSRIYRNDDGTFINTAGLTRTTGAQAAGVT